MGNNNLRNKQKAEKGQNFYVSPTPQVNITLIWDAQSKIKSFPAFLWTDLPGLNVVK